MTKPQRVPPSKLSRDFEHLPHQHQPRVAVTLVEVGALIWIVAVASIVVITRLDGQSFISLLALLGALLVLGIIASIIALNLRRFFNERLGGGEEPNKWWQGLS